MENLVPETYVTEHFRLFQQRFERFQKVHHGRIRFEVGKMIIDP